ncbi:MAG TPA: hypothetical protein VEB41_13175 [Burkholderiales bacterium]|nr:hypothetical protein [Burkholderiales bacterium]
MPVVFQLAGRLRASDASIQEKLRAAFAGCEPLLKGQPGFVEARLLASYSTHQVQLLLSWETYEAGAAFQRTGYPALSRALALLVEPRGTLITSVLERSVEAAQT